MSVASLVRRARHRPVLAALVVAVLVTAAGYGVAAPSVAAGQEVLGPGLVTVRMGVEHSQFSTDGLQVRPGTVVRFVVENEDPIHHELVVGPASVHQRHQLGTERAHPPVPGEVSVGPNETAVTFYRFDRPGTVDFACHLPRHLEYGMFGTITVRE